MVISCELIHRDRFLLEQGRHPKDSLLVLTSGSFFCKINGQEYETGPNEIFFFKNTDFFNRKIISPLTAIYIVFDELPISASRKLTFSNIARVMESITYLKTALTEENTNRVLHYIEDILIFSNQETKKHDQMIYEITDYLKETLQTNHSLDELALKYNLSKQWLILRFKKETGTTPIQFLNNIRLQRAKELILNQKMNFNQIALACGYENQYYFSTAFKKAFGISPSHWRKNMIL